MRMRKNTNLDLKPLLFFKAGAIISTHKIGLDY